MTDTTQPLTLVVGRTYRAKKPACAQGLVNDRTIKWMSSYGDVQYDGPAVAHGRHYPKVTKDAFLKWADRDVTDELPPQEYATWPIPKGGAA